MLVICGEALIDIITRSQDKSQLSAHIGGGPFNVAVAYAKLGGQSGFLHPLSQDHYGAHIKKYLTDNNIEYLCPYVSPWLTPLAMTYTDENNKPGYNFYRRQTADRDLRSAELLKALPQKIDFIHSGTLAISESPDVDVTVSLCRAAKERGAIVSIDPNIRANNFPDAEPYRKSVRRALAVADIIKLSDDDSRFLYPKADSEAALSLLRRDFPAARLLVMTRGTEDMLAMVGDDLIRQATGKAPIKGDTIGAGDCFIAALLFAIGEKNIGWHDIQAQDMQEFLRFADEIATVNCQYFGCFLPQF